MRLKISKLKPKIHAQFHIKHTRILLLKQFQRLATRRKAFPPWGCAATQGPSIPPRIIAAHAGEGCVCVALTLFPARHLGGVLRPTSRGKSARGRPSRGKFDSADVRAFARRWLRGRLPPYTPPLGRGGCTRR